MKSGLKIGDEVNIIMPAETSFQKWDGGDLNEPEKNQIFTCQSSC